MAIGAVPRTFAKVVAVAGTREAVSATKLLCREVVIQALPTNAGYIYLGDDTVAAANGIILEPGKSIVITDMMGRSAEEFVDLVNIYLDTNMSGDAVRVLYMERPV